MTNKQAILNALMSKYQGQRDEIACNLEIYINAPTSIPEHVSFIEYVDKMVAELTELNDKMKTVEGMMTDAKRLEQ